VSEREHNWAEQREQLSALLDNELAGAERADLEAHLQGCADCRAELESLRRTRALLRALPQPALPRRFLLPLEPAAQQFASESTQAQRSGLMPLAPSLAQPARPAPVPLSAARSSRILRSTQVVRWLSAIAAILGLFLLLGSAFSSFSPGKGTTTSASNAPGAYAVNTPTQAGGTALGTTPPPQSTEKATTTQDRATPTGARPNPGATATANGSETDSNTTPVPTGEDHNTVSSGGGSSLSTPELGLILLVLGVIGFVGAAIVRRLWPNANR
jgi:anti-sigma factor RsiW